MIGEGSARAVETKASDECLQTDKPAEGAVKTVISEECLHSVSLRTCSQARCSIRSSASSTGSAAARARAEAAKAAAATAEAEVLEAAVDASNDSHSCELNTDSLPLVASQRAEQYVIDQLREREPELQSSENSDATKKVSTATPTSQS